MNANSENDKKTKNNFPKFCWTYKSRVDEPIFLLYSIAILLNLLLLLYVDYRCFSLFQIKFHFKMGNISHLSPNLGFNIMSRFLK